MRVDVHRGRKPVGTVSSLSLETLIEVVCIFPKHFCDTIYDGDPHSRSCCVTLNTKQLTTLCVAPNNSFQL